MINTSDVWTIKITSCTWRYYQTSLEAYEQDQSQAILKIRQSPYGGHV